jgi:hypothetical protein
MLIPVLLKIGSAEWSVHVGDAHGVLEKDMLDVSLAPIYLNIYLQDLRIWIKFSNKFCIKDLVVVSNVWDKVHSCVMNKLVVLAQWMKSFGWLRIKLFSLILVDIITIIYNRDFYFRALGSLVVLSFPRPLSFSLVLPKPLSETLTRSSDGRNPV